MLICIMTFSLPVEAETIPGWKKEPLYPQRLGHCSQSLCRPPWVPRTEGDSPREAAHWNPAQDSPDLLSLLAGKLLTEKKSLPSCSVAGQTVTFKPFNSSGSQRTGGKWFPRQMALWNHCLRSSFALLATRMVTPSRPRSLKCL